MFRDLAKDRDDRELGGIGVPPLGRSTQLPAMTNALSE